MNPTLTIGHSNLSYDAFRDLLELAGVTAIADVRTTPFSRYHPWFNGARLAEALKADGIAYVGMGEQLGGRPADASLFRDGIADYEAMARVPAFLAGVERVLAGAARHTIALMCSEGDPTECHRCLLVGRALHTRGQAVQHLHKDGSFLTQEGIEDRLVDWLRPRGGGLFDAPPSLDEAYAARARRIAYGAKKAVTPPAGA